LRGLIQIAVQLAEFDANERITRRHLRHALVAADSHVTLTEPTRDIALDLD
jgi:hypothetical protein